MDFSACFLGVGSARHSSLGHACCLIEKQQRPWLMIDCGPDSLARYAAFTHETLPAAVFITHLHYDHMAGLEQLFFQCCLSRPAAMPTLYIAAALVPQLCHMLAHTGLAEGGKNVWDCLQLVPVVDSFWHQGQRLSIYPVRHHQAGSAFALHMPGLFFFTGDTRPIPEILHHQVGATETIFHDCSLKGNPSHSGVGDLLYEYDTRVLSRMRVYHYGSSQEADKIRAQGLQVVRCQERIILGISSAQREWV